MISKEGTECFRSEITTVFSFSFFHLSERRQTNLQLFILMLIFIKDKEAIRKVPMYK